MAKIDESKQYKFIEIIAMLENKELPAGTAIRRENKKYGEKILEIQGNGLDLVQKFGKGKISVIVGNVEINSFWSIKLPEEDKFYLKAPDAFKNGYLNLHLLNRYYLVNDKNDTTMHQTKFTQKEIDTFPFDTTFFEKVKVEQGDE